jgi:hypothetical protein
VLPRATLLVTRFDFSLIIDKIGTFTPGKNRLSVLQDVTTACRNELALRWDLGIGTPVAAV